VSVEGAYTNRVKEGVARAAIGEGEVTVRGSDAVATETQLANLNRDVDDVVEVTSEKTEGFELYVSDTGSVKYLSHFRFQATAPWV